MTCKLEALTTIRVSSLANDTGSEFTTEMDSHADTCVVGKGALILRDYERPVKVTGYDGTGTETPFKTVSAAVAYDDPDTGRSIIIVIHQAIWIPQLLHNLLCPMQARMNDIEVDERPKFLTRLPSNQSHAITFRGDDGERDYTIPLSLQGVTSFFPTRKPTKPEFDSSESVFEMTYAEPEWDPHSNTFEEQEKNMMDVNGRVRDRMQGRNPIKLMTVSSNEELAGNYQARFFGRCLTANRTIGSVQSSIKVRNARSADRGQRRMIASIQAAGAARSISAMSSTNLPAVDPQVLANKWGIGLEAATRTLTKTTQRGVRNVLHPTLTRRFRTNDRNLRYRRLPVTLFGDTLESSVKSLRGNRYAEVFGTSFGWTRAFPMRKKSEAHDALSLLFSRDGVPAVMVVDGSKEQTLGKFRKKCREADCHIRQTEPYTPSSNAAEGCIRELKRGVGRKMTRMKSPKPLWDHCLELQAHKRSNTCHDIYELDGEVPETIVSGQTSDISPFIEYEWYEWCMFYDSSVSFPKDKEVLGRWLGPSTDVGSAMTYKLLKSNGEVVYRSTVRPLTRDEVLDPTHVNQRGTYDAAISVALGPAINVDDLDHVQHRRENRRTDAKRI